MVAKSVNEWMIKSNCKHCQKETVGKHKKKVFCDIQCKAEWQKTQKPVDKEWLIQKYIVEELSAYDIAKIVNRNPKQVWYWLKGYDIQTRTRSEELQKNNYMKMVARGEKPHATAGKSLSKQHKSKISQSRTGQHYPKLKGENNGMFGVRGEKHPNWKGGSTPERQRFYASSEWKEIYKLILKRDNYKCQKCGVKGKVNCIKRGKKMIGNLCIHHIISFLESKELRSTSNNLITLCIDCHLWVHSKENKEKEYIKYVRD